MTTRNIYNRPVIKVKNWLVTKDDVKKIYDFLIRRYKVSSIEISLETTSGNNKIYESFKEFEDDIDNLRALKENIEKINISHSGGDRSNRTHIWVIIDFSYHRMAFFRVAGEGNSETKDWVDGSFEEMKRIAQSFELTDKGVISFLKNELGEGWRKATVTADFWGEAKNKLESRLKKSLPTKTAPKESWHTTWWGKIIIGLTTGFILLWLGYKFFGN